MPQFLKQEKNSCQTAHSEISACSLRQLPQEWVSSLPKTLTIKMSDSRPIVMPELPATCGAAVRLHRIVRGHLSVTLYNGDCLDVLSEISGVDAVITDPPYGMNLDTKFSERPLSEASRKKHPVQRDYKAIIGDAEPFDPSPIVNICREVFLFGADYYRDKLPPGGSWLVWDKRHGIEDVEYSSSEFELCWTKVKRKRRILRSRWFGLCGTETQDVRTRIHPAQKPIQVCAWLMEMTDAKMVLDPYMGSGTTGIACLRTGRSFIGIEKDPDYFATAVARLEREANQGALL